MAIKKFLISIIGGAFLGAFEGGVVFSLLLVIESRDGFAFGGFIDWLVPVFIMGMIFGGIVGAIIGALVSLINYRRSAGLAIGLVVGLFAAEALVFGMTLDVSTVLLIIATILAGGSIGLVTSLLTFRERPAQKPDNC